MADTIETGPQGAGSQDATVTTPEGRYVQDTAQRDGSQNTSDIFARGVDIYRAAGWKGTIPSWNRGDKRPLAGFTGYNGGYPDDAQIEEWKHTYPGSNLLLRLTPDLIGIDFDAYDNKTGAKTWDECEKRWGPMPPAWRSTSRIDDPVSGIYIFRIPVGFRARGEIAFKELGIGDVELIQHHHRTAAVWPSVHPKTGKLYRWFNPHEELVDEGVVPHVR